MESSPGTVAARPVSSNGDGHLAPIKIRTRDLSFFYGRFRALKDVTLEIRANRVTAIIGPSGCGKSTLLQVFNRMYDLVPGARARGSARIDEEEITTTGRLYDLRRRVGMVFQRPNPLPMSIYENVAYGPRLLGWSKARADRAVERSLRVTGLWDEVSDRLRAPATSISGGQQQRLCIARCIAVDPEVILMDEPCSALDPISTMRIEELIRQLRDDYTIVIVTHNMQQAKRISDDTAFMLIEPFLRHGELIEAGLTEAIFSRPRDVRTRDYVDGKFG